MRIVTITGEWKNGNREVEAGVFFSFSLDSFYANCYVRSISTEMYWLSWRSRDFYEVKRNKRKQLSLNSKNTKANGQRPFLTLLKKPKRRK